MRLFLVVAICLVIIGAVFYDSREAVASHPDGRITSFSSSKTKTVSGEAVTISWTSFGVTNVNLQTDCSDYVQVTSTSYAGGPLPCSTKIFSSSLPPNSSLVVNFTNPSSNDQPFRFILFPTFGDGIYDGIHSVPLSLTVITDTTPDADVRTFIASSTAAVSGSSLNLLWVIDNAKGANMKISCNPDVAVATSSDAAALGCGIFAFNPDLAAKDSRPLFFSNKASTEQSVTLTIAPVLLKGGYDLARSRALTIRVGPKLAVVPQTPIPATLPAPQSPQAAPYVKSPPASPPKNLAPAAPKTTAPTPGVIQGGTPAPLFPPLPPKEKKTPASEAPLTEISIAPKVFTFFGRIIDFIKYIFWFAPSPAN